jgi:hypothetical protein
MPGYKREREYIRNKYGLKVETCHVAHVKESLGLTRHKASNRINPDGHVKPCPKHLWSLVEEAVRFVHSR